MDFTPFLEILGDVSLVFAAVFGVLAFLRRGEQTKDEAFAQLAARLCAPEPVLRAAAARQLPSFFRYRRYLFLWRPYRTQALNLATDALKMRRDEAGQEPREERFVRQALADALGYMLSRARSDELVNVRLIRANLNELIMQDYRDTPVRPATTHFVFDYTDLTEACALRTGLKKASFVHAHLWKAKLCDSDLQGADFTEAALWDVDFSHADLRGAKLLTANVENANFHQANLSRGQLSPKVMGLCLATDCKLDEAREVKDWPRPRPPRFQGPRGRVD